MPEEALTSFAVSDAYRYSMRVSRIEYLIPTNNIIVLDSYFNLTNKSNLFHWEALIRFYTIFDHLVVAYFFGLNANACFGFGTTTIFWEIVKFHFTLDDLTWNVKPCIRKRCLVHRCFLGLCLFSFSQDF